MADKAKTFFQKFHLKPSTTLKVSKTAIFVLLGLISVQTVVGGLLWYAKQIQASGGITQVGSLPNFAYHYALPDDIAVGPDGNVHVSAEPTGNNRIQETTNSGGEVRMWGEIVGGPAQFQNEVKIAFDSSNNAYVLDQIDLRVVKFNSSRVYQSQFGSAGTGDGQFQSPSGIAVDASGNVYVADSGNNRVQKFNSNGIYQSQFGSAGVGNGQFTGMGSIAIDASGNIYVTDASRIQKFDSSGVYQSQFGSAGTGNGQFLNGSIGDVGVDAAGNVYAADPGSFRVQKFNSSGAYQLQWGSQGTGNSQFTELAHMAVSGDGYVYALDVGQNGAYSTALKKFNSSGVYQSRWGNAEPGQFTDPMGVTTDTAGNRYVVDYLTGRIQKFNSSNQYIAEWGGRTTDHTAGKFYNEGFLMLASDGSNNIYATNTAFIEKFNSSGANTGSWALPANKYATGIAASSGGTVYVGTVDSISGASSVLRYSSAGALLGQWGGTGSGDGQFATGGVMGMDVDSVGNVYVVDSGNFRIQKFSSTGTYLAKWGSQGGGNGQFEAALALSIDPQDRVYVIDYAGQGMANCRIQKFSSAGVFLTSATITTATFTLSAEGSGVLLAPDMASSTVKVLQDNTSIEISTTSLPNGAVGQAYSQTIATVDGQGTTAFSILAGSLPSGLSLNASTGEISGTPNVAGTTTFTVQASDNEASDTQVLSITVDAVARSVTTGAATSVSQYTASLNGLTNLPNNVTQRGFQYGLTASYGSSTQDNTSPIQYSFVAKWDTNASSNTTGLATDSLGNVYAVEYNDSQRRVVKRNSSGAFVAEWGNAGGPGALTNPCTIQVDSSDNIYVQSGGYVKKYTSAGDYLSQTSIYANWGASCGSDGFDLDSSGNIYAVRTDAASVRVYSQGGAILREFGSYGGNNGEFRNPMGIYVDAQDRVYVADLLNNRIQRFASDGTYQIQWGGTGNVEGNFNGPTYIAQDNSGNIYVADTGNNRVQKFDADGVYITQWGSYVDRGPGDGYFDTPSGLAVSPDDYVYVRDAGNYRVQKFGGAITSEVVSLQCETTYHYRAYATDANGTTYGNDATFTTSTCPDIPINITNTTLQDGMELVPYQDLVNVEYATGSVTYSLASGTLPDGLILNTTTGYIEGTPTQSGIYSFAITAEDSNSSDTGNYNLTVLSYAPPLQITTNALPDAQIWQENFGYQTYSQYIYAQNNVGDVVFSVTSGSLPPGLTLNDQAVPGLLQGVPTQAGTYTFTVQAQDSRGNGIGGTDTQQYTIVVPSLPGINITTTSLENGRVDVPYDKTITYEWWVDAPVFSVVSGSLPPGVSLSLNGYLQGTPTQAGTYTFTIQAEDSYASDTQQLTMVVDPAIAPIVNTPFVTIISPSTGATFTGGSSTITGTGPANQTITLYVDNQQVGTTTANAQGNWTYSAAGIAAGSHTLDAKWVPGAEVAFVAGYDPALLSPVIEVIDTNTRTKIKRIGIDAPNAIPISATVSRDGNSLYLTDFDSFTLRATLWRIDLQTLSIDSLTSDQPASVFEQILLSADGKVGYMVETSLTGLGATLRTVDLQTFTLSPGNTSLGDRFNNSTLLGQGHSLALSPDESKLFVANTFGGASITVINTADMSVYYTQALPPLSEGNGVLISGLDVQGTKLTIALMDTMGQSNNYLAETSRIYIADYVEQSVVAVIPTPGVPWYVLDMVGDGSTFLQGASGSDLVIAKLSLDSVYSSSSVAFSDVGAYGSSSLRGLLAPSTSLQKLYFIVSDTDGGTPYTKFITWNNANNALESEGGVLTLSMVSYAAGSNFIGPITPPKDSISFTVPQGSTPPPTDCTATNTCPKPPTCQETNTCPKPVDCTTTNTCPPTTTTSQTPPTTPVTPQIISTQLPTPGATPATSRLGWLDRTALAVARFVPQQAAIGFPYLLFILLLLFALSLYYQSSNEIRKDKLNREFLAKRKSIRAQQDNFIALASHYLNTPITIIQGGVEMEEGKRKH